MVEVIAEVHWALDRAPSGQEVDRAWFRLADQATAAFIGELPFVEELQPAGFTVPLEMFGRAPLLRFRPSIGAWPCVQLGQGLLTVNAIPPYDGWPAVRDLLSRMLRSASHSSSAFSAIRLEKLKLNYRDAFTAEHGANFPQQFLEETLPFARANLLDPFSHLAAGKIGALNGEFAFPLRSPAGADASMRYGAGTVNKAGSLQEAAIVEFNVAGPISGTLDINAVLSWFDKAHESAWQLFEAAIPTKLMDRLKGEPE